MDQRAKAETFEREKAELSEAGRTRTRAYGFAPTAALRDFPSPLRPVTPCARVLWHLTASDGQLPQRVTPSRSFDMMENTPAFTPVGKPL